MAKSTTKSFNAPYKFCTELIRQLCNRPTEEDTDYDTAGPPTKAQGVSL